MIQDTKLTQAVAAIPQRSERQQDPRKLLGSFVDVGILPQINNVNNQIMYGRRGTGKTHVLKVFESQLATKPANAVIYIDARTLGSTSQFSDMSISLTSRCIALFRDTLAEIHNGLLEHVVARGGEKANAALDELDHLAKVSTEPFTSVAAEQVSERGLARAGEKTELHATASASAVSIGGSKQVDGMVEKEKSAAYSIQNIDKIVFPAVSGALDKTLKLVDSKLFILLDEWSSLPTDVQPYLAEFLKRSFLPLSSVTLKIASLEYRSDFAIQTDRGIVGFEMGADISAHLDIDDYYVYDRNPEAITDIFADMLFKHLGNELPEGYLQGLGVSGGKDLASKLFTERKVFEELVRASEGVARDLINIFSIAYFTAHRKSREKIDRSAIIEAARQWFEQDKERNLDPTLVGVLRRIIDEVIGKRKARSFLLPRELSNHAVIQRLFDLRVLHLVQRGYADKDRPGVRYNIYSLDYGTYVDLLNTSKKPDPGFLEIAEGDSGDYVVPFDDKRSIRRIILDEHVLA